MATKKDKNIKVAEEVAKELLKLMGSKAKTKVTYDDEQDAVYVDIDTKDETGLLIGNRGETLNSLQTIIGMICYKKIGEWQRVIVNISDWRERQEKRLKELAEQAAARAVDTNSPQTLYNLNASQRRIIHMYLSENKEVETESIGEGKERYLVVKNKK